MRLSFVVDRCGLALVVALTVVALARPASAGTIRHDRTPQAYLDLAAAPVYASAGRVDVTSAEPSFVGSGTLIDDNWVLTAAHLLDGAASSARFNVGGREYMSDGWVVHPRWNGDPRRGNDIALVRLADPVAGVTPTGIYRGRDEFGQTGVFVGNGRTGNGQTGANAYDGLTRAGQNVIDGMSVGRRKIYTTRLARSARIFVVDFDNPDRPGDNVVGAAEPTELELLISQGDSGGGVFLDTPAGPLVAGIHSYGEAPVGADDSGYGDVTGHTRVSAYANWIAKTMRRDRVSPYSAAASARALAFARSFELDATLTGLSLGDVAAGGEASAASPLAAAAPVPEPTGAAALLVLVAAAASRRFRRGC